MMSSTANAGKDVDKTTVQVQTKDKDVEVKKTASAVLFLTPEVASYFIGEHRLDLPLIYHDIDCIRV
jgi:hypothetical protein